MTEERTELAELYDLYAPGLLAFLCGRLKDAMLAEDVLHDVFIAYHRHAEKLTILSPKAYLYRIADRLSQNVRRHQAIASRARSEIARNKQTWQTAPGVDPFQADAMRQALAELTDEERDVLIMRVYGELTFQEISNMLSMPLTTVFKRHAKAISAMQGLLSESR
jgi:RNA polymerase sigma-70 factor (ECF subfamily)